ncbi:MAG: hypothetical protein IKV21_04225 [Clostridia bacterium]|nr:hypothetical protein [Clostridia bacterium]
MRFASSRNIYIRRALTVLLIFMTALFQHSAFVPPLFGAPAMLLIPLTVCVAMFERSIPGMCFGVLAGVLWDCATPGGDGFFSVMLTAVGFITGALVTFIFRNNIRSALILSFGALTVCNVSYWLMFIFRKGYEGAFDVLFTRYLPSVLYSLIFVFVYYYLVSFILRLTSENRQ